MVIWIFLLLQSVFSLRNSTINVHLIAHTHDDVGWLKTVDEYYYGANNTIYKAGVQYILDSVVQELYLDPTKRFSYVEIGFFSRWWYEQGEIVKNVVKKLVRDGQLVFLNAGWSMHDEAGTYFQDMLDNMATGHRFLLKNFNVTPSVGWQIDPFGHSSANADMYAKMGFNGLYFARIDYQDKIYRLANNTLEMVWDPTAGTGSPSGIFTHVLYAHYSWPAGYCFDTLCRDDPIMDDPRLENYNADWKAAGLVSYLHEQAEHYNSNELMVTIGDDFNYQNADENFKNMDKLIRLINADPNNGLNLFYSTPDNYTQAVYSAGLAWPNKTDDFFPYADNPHSYWTGYFTSRPTLKGYIRQSGSLLRAVQNMLGNMMLFGIVGDTLLANAYANLHNFQEKMGLLQHHDAVTGTSRQAVAYDYYRHLAEGVNAIEPTIKDLLEIAVNNATGEHINFGLCNQRNISLCDYTQYMESEAIEIVAFNPNFQKVDTVLSVPIAYPKVTVVDDTNTQLLVDIVETPYQVHFTNATYTLYWSTTVPALGHRAFKIYQNSSAPAPESFDLCVDNCDINNELYTLSITTDPETNWHLERKDSHFATGFNVTLAHYLGSIGNENSTQTSGAYIFRPQTNMTEDPTPYGNIENIMYYKGHNIEMAITNYDNAAFQLFKLYQNVKNSHLNVQTFISSIPITDGWGKEIVLLFGGYWDSEGNFRTDSNGMNMVERKRDFQPTYNLNYTTEPSSCNYYPVNSALTIHEPYTDFSYITVVNDRAQGGTVQNLNGFDTIEMMVHRRLLHDDFRGVGEALNETMQDDHDKGLEAMMNHIVLIGNSIPEQRNAETFMNEPVQLFFGHSQNKTFASNSWNDYIGDIPPNFSIHYRPDNYHNGIMIRIRNMYDTAASLDLTEITKTYLGAYEYTEMSLSENQKMETILENRFQWQVESRSEEEEELELENLKRMSRELSSSIHFNPGQIRTFFIPLSFS